jgi:hypothetical protein
MPKPHRIEEHVPIKQFDYCLAGLLIDCAVSGLLCQEGGKKVVNHFLAKVVLQLSVNKFSEQTLVIVVERARILRVEIRHILQNEVKLFPLELLIINSKFLHVTKDFLVQRSHRHSRLHRHLGTARRRIAKICDHGFHFVVQRGLF